MYRTAVSFAVALIAATSPAAFAQRGGAQEPRNSQQDGRNGDSGIRTVTVIGCVQSGPGGGRATERAVGGGQSSTQYILTNASVREGGGTTATGGTSSKGAGGQGPGNRADAAEDGSSSSGATGSSGRSPAGATVGTTGSASGAISDRTYTLVGSDDIPKHVGHEVEVTGVLMSTPGSGTSTNGTGDRGRSGSQTGANGSSGSGSSSGASGSAGTGGKDTSTGQRSDSLSSSRQLQVSTIRMISMTCSQ